MCSYSGHYKLADLGLARIISHLSDDIEEGDARYMASELLRLIGGEMPDLTKADIFSLGCSIYELMNGLSLPMNGEGWQEIRRGVLEFREGFSEELKETIRRMMGPVD